MILQIEIPASAIPALGRTSKEHCSRLRLMAAAKLYEVGDLSQERAAELAGIPRLEFLRALSELQVSPFQGVAEDLAFVDSLP